MSKLTRLIIEDFGKAAIDLACPIKLNLYPFSNMSLEEVIDSSFFNQKNKEKIDHLLKIREKIGEERIAYNRNNTTFLASRKLRHDFDNLITPIHMALSSRAIELFRGNPAKYTDIISKAMLSQFYARTIAITTAYIASEGKNPDYTFKIPVSHLNALLKKPLGEKTLIFFPKEIAPADVQYISSPEFVAVYQMLKNSQGTLVSVEVLQEKINNKPYCSIQIEDNGQGLLNTEGSPLSAKEIDKIFYGKTTKPNNMQEEDIGGVGLQVARKLIELRRGNIEVFTKNNNFIPRYFSLFPESNIVLYKKPIETAHGTRFTITVPINSENTILKEKYKQGGSYTQSVDL